MQSPAPSVGSNSKWQLAQRLDGEKKRLGWEGNGVTDLSHQNWLENWGGGWIGAFRWTSSFSLFPDPHEVLAGEKTLPPPSPAAISLMLGHLWARRVDSSSHRITMLPNSKQTSIWPWWWFLFPFFLRNFNEVGPLMADELSLHCLLNIQDQTLILWILCIDK